MTAISIALCFIPLAAVFLGIALLAEGFKIQYGLLSCALGLTAVFPIAVTQVVFQGFFDTGTLVMLLVRALIFNGLIEESIKMLIFFLLPAKKMQLKNFFQCAVLGGLALACFETLLYLVSGYAHIELRLISAVVIHVVCGGLGGIFVYSVAAAYLFAYLCHHAPRRV